MVPAYFGDGADINTRVAGDVVIVDVVGRMTAGPWLVRLADAIDTSLDAGFRKIVLNLAAVTYIDSSGIGELNATLLAVTGKGGSLKLLQASRRVQDMLRVIGLYPLFSFEQQEEEALSHLAGV